jgi:hypothetical protein
VYTWKEPHPYYYFRLRLLLDWILYLLTTSPHDSELQVITAPPLITTTHAKSFPACCVFTNRSLVTASNNGDSSASALKFSLNGGSLTTILQLTSSSLPNPVQNLLDYPNCLLSTNRVDNTVHFRIPLRCRKSVFTEPSLAAAVYSCLLIICCLATDVVPLSVSLPLPRN